MVSGKVAAEQTGPSQLELEPTDAVACRHSVVTRGESECEQLISLCRHHLLLRNAVQTSQSGQSTDSVTDWTKRM